jgi:hypothetical protein
MPTLRIHTHWQVAQISDTGQNLPKSMAAPTLKNEKKIKHENTTRCIVHTLRDTHHSQTVSGQVKTNNRNSN